jgi:hypothetical protein
MTDKISNLEFNYSQVINNETLDIYLDPHGNWQDEIEGFEMSHLNFTWNVTKYENRTLTIQLYFNDPLQISPLSQQDYIVFHFKEVCPHFLSLDRAGIIDPADRTLRKRIRKQIPLKMKNDLALGTASVIKGALFGSLFVGVSIGICLTGILSILLAMINGL